MTPQLWTPSKRRIRGAFLRETMQVSPPIRTPMDADGGTFFGVQDLGSTFVPSQISGLQVWLDSTSGLTTGAWVDKSSNAYSFTGHGTPTINASDANFGGKQTVTFSSVLSQYYSLATVTPLNNPSTVIVAFKYTGTSALTAIAGNNSGGGSGYVYPGFSSLNAYEISDGGVNTLTGGVTNSSVHIIAAICDGSNNWSIYLDGSLLAGPTAKTAIVATGMNVAATFGGISAADFFSGTLASVLVYNSALSTANLAKVRTYLQNEFSI